MHHSLQNKDLLDASHHQHSSESSPAFLCSFVITPHSIVYHLSKKQKEWLQMAHVANQYYSTKLCELPEGWKNQKPFIELAIKIDVRYLTQASDRLKCDPDILQYVMERSPTLLRMFYLNFESVFISHRSMSYALSMDGLLLGRIPQYMQTCELVEIALQQNSESFMHVSPHRFQDSIYVQWFYQCYKRDPRVFRCYMDYSSKFHLSPKQEHALKWDAIHRYPGNIQYLPNTDALRHDKNVIHHIMHHGCEDAITECTRYGTVCETYYPLIIERAPRALLFLSYLIDDPSWIRKAIIKDGTIFSKYDWLIDW